MTSTRYSSLAGSRRTTGTVGTKDDLVSAGAACVDMHAFREGNMAWGPVVAALS